jgi:hypothetical protein
MRALQDDLQAHEKEAARQALALEVEIITLEGTCGR